MTTRLKKMKKEEELEDWRRGRINKKNEYNKDCK